MHFLWLFMGWYVRGAVTGGRGAAAAASQCGG